MAAGEHRRRTGGDVGEKKASAGDPRGVFLTSEQMCEALGVSDTKLRQLVRAGTVRVVRLGARTLRYPADQLTEMAKGGE